MKKAIAAMAAAVTLAVFGAGFAAQPAKVVPDTVTVLSTKGMTCGSCAGRIEGALKKVPGVAVVESDVPGGRVVVSYDSKQAAAAALAQTVTSAGYDSSVVEVVPAARYREATGRDPGQSKGQEPGCACCNRK